ncbi:hypothetical protein [Micromonospora fluostatini]|uniref:hypothetical protein n=1 Tax=Micromonospora sp. JCM 30529 TaxID=3421643 RepID=UPI003D17246D
MARSIRKYLGHRGYRDPGVLVAFSGTLSYDGEETTEAKENGGLAESALPKGFAYTRADDRTAQAGGSGQPEYRILVVAEKYQTGFDQPFRTRCRTGRSLAPVLGRPWPSPLAGRTGGHAGTGVVSGMWCPCQGCPWRRRDRVVRQHRWHRCPSPAGGHDRCRRQELVRRIV